MARAPKPAAAGPKPADTGGAPPVPAASTASAGAAGAVGAESTAGSDPVGDAAAAGTKAGGGAGKDLGAAAGTAPEVRAFEAARTILHDGIEYQAGAAVPFTRSAFEALPQGAVAGDWAD